MSLATFHKFTSNGGDKFEFRIASENEMFLFHYTDKDEFVNDYKLEGGTDKEKIENGLFQIGDFLENLSIVESTINIILWDLNRTRSQMQ